MSSGIYAITNTATGEMYIGRSYLLDKRAHEHLYKLRNGNHHTRKLQAAWNEYGEDAFRFYVLEVIDTSVNRALEEAEARWIQRLRPAYNRLRPVRGKVNAGENLWHIAPRPA